MTARVLVVDDIPANVKLLEARLQAEYFEVLTAHCGQEAVDICAAERVDVVLLDVMMPGMDGFEACRRIKSDAKTQDLPVIMVTALDQTSDKLEGLEAGADDFLTKPVDDIALITRVKNLARLKTLNDEMNLRASVSSQFGYDSPIDITTAAGDERGRILFVDNDDRAALRISDAVRRTHDVVFESDLTAALLRVGEQDFDLLVVSLSLDEADGLRLCGQVRSLERGRHLPIVLLVEPGDEARLLRGLDMGVNDYVMRPIDHNELMARVRTQIKRKRYADFLRNRLEESVERAITDPLTGLHNRHYMHAHLRRLVDDAVGGGRPLALLVADIDYFKRINDTYGHDVGDVVLQEFARRFRHNTRAVDLVCRIGGEEFMLVMPDVDTEAAYQIAERLRERVAERPFVVSPQLSVPITASVGLASVGCAQDTPERIFKRADNALYAAKRDGRNRVVANAA